jgi:hypothetical protein
MRPPPRKLDVAAAAFLVVVSLIMVLLVAVVVWSGPRLPPRSTTAQTRFGSGWRCENLPESTGAVMCDRYPRAAPPVGPTAVRAPPPTSEPTAVAP